ncbi:MAG: hypothetical protein ACYC0M_02930 [Burkholderiales bacterium]
MSELISTNVTLLIDLYGPSEQVRQYVTRQDKKKVAGEVLTFERLLCDKLKTYIQ